MAYFTDMAVPKPPPTAYTKSRDDPSKQRFIQQGDVRLPKGSSHQAQSTRERIVMAKLAKDLELIDSQKRIVVNAVEQEMHQLRMCLRDIEEGKSQVSPYLTDVDARRSLTSSSMGPTPRLLMKPIVSMSKSDLAKQRAKLLQREYKKQNEMNEYLNHLFQTISDRNIKELSNLATSHNRSANTAKSKMSSCHDIDEASSVVDDTNPPSAAKNTNRRGSTFLEVPKMSDKMANVVKNKLSKKASKIELPRIDACGLSRERSKVSFKLDSREDSTMDESLEQEVSKMASNLLQMQKRSARIRRKLTDQNMVWTDGAMALSLRKLRREKNRSEEYVIKNSSSSRALLALTKEADSIDRSKTVEVQKGRLKLHFKADDRAKKNRDHRKFQSGRNQKIETKIMSFVQH
ncbi:uncharacterized protein LOC134848463 [Symsagittifera roscoffensis]|uniref:uncharacterized protein LOC134848463 n=1 Tax=Symsagittifera roscoffensis TaxID=84072 RepID=UPI00307C90AD